MASENLLNRISDSLTLSNYETALEFLRSSEYQFSKGISVEISPLVKTAILRHDVDFILNPVIPMASVEKKLNLPATYFFLTNAPKYNLISDEGLGTIFELRQMGHEIGIHLDSAGITNIDELKRALDRDLNFYRTYLNFEPKCFSYHMPSAEILQMNSKNLLGLTNYYAADLFNQFNYLSDSNGYWRQHTLRSFLESSKGQNIYLLTHPVWWGKDEGTPRERLKSSLERSDKNFEDWYEGVCKKYNRRYW